MAALGIDPPALDAALVSFFVADAIEAAGPGVPLQVHTGLGDADQSLLGADPALLQPQLDHGFLAGVPVVLLHCYPFVRHAGYLASIYRDVHVDLSLALTLVPQRGSALVGEALELTPASKLLFATDASRLPEMYVLGARWWRESLARALGDLVDDDVLDEPLALDWAEQILAGNARRLYWRVSAALGCRSARSVRSNRPHPIDSYGQKSTTPVASALLPRASIAVTV